MIPKIIHYSWFSGEKFPPAYEYSIETWKKVLPDYEFRLWDAESLKEVNAVFANEAYNARKWAFAADVVRVYALYHYGGIWLDCDVVMVKSFDCFLNHRLFIGKEYSEEYLLAGGCRYFNNLASNCIGAEPGHPFMKDCLDYYEGRHFVQSSNEFLPQVFRYDMRLLPTIQAVLATKYGYVGDVENVDMEEVLNEDIHVKPAFFFDRPRYHQLSEVYCVHHRCFSWGKGLEQKADFVLGERPRKKDLFYYMFVWVNKVLKRRGLRIRVESF